MRRKIVPDGRNECETVALVEGGATLSPEMMKCWVCFVDRSDDFSCPGCVGWEL